MWREFRELYYAYNKLFDVGNINLIAGGNEIYVTAIKNARFALENFIDEVLCVIGEFIGVVMPKTFLI